MNDYITRFRELYYREFDKDGYAAVDVTYENIKDLLITLATEQFEAGKAAGRNEAVDHILTNADIGSMPEEAHTYFLQVAGSARNEKSI